MNYDTERTIKKKNISAITKPQLANVTHERYKRRVNYYYDRFTHGRELYLQMPVRSRPTTYRVSKT